MNIRDINEFSLWQYVRRQVNKENEKQIKDFAEKMNLDITEPKNIINSDDIINANGRLDNLCKDKLTNEVKILLSKEFEIPLFKVKQIKYINYVKEFIISQRKKQKYLSRMISNKSKKRHISDVFFAWVFIYISLMLI
ncbi:hypothetical protein [Mycoplasma capricolum]|uniref:hypothetical protein n=1 Tax=Mycoplasma capricolum TaxID=2095 RepID=UPI001FB65126|nr:hypothetical protein [Mycoplasma capricolum]